MAPSTSGLAIASLACSIAGVFLFPIILSVLGIVFGHISLNRIKRSDGLLKGRGLAIAGLIIGYAGLVICVALIILVILIVIASAARNGATS